MNFNLFTKMLGLIGLVIWTADAQAQTGGPFNLNWNTCDGGGGSCNGGTTPAGSLKFSMTGTVGQPDAGGSIAGTYVQQGGFIPAFTLPVTPTMSVTHVGSQFTFTWPNICTGFVLEGAPTVNGPWTFLSSGTVVGANWRATVFSPTSPAFFRLRKDCPR